MAPKYPSGCVLAIDSALVGFMRSLFPLSASLMFYFTWVHITLHRKIAVKQGAHYQPLDELYSHSRCVCSCKWCHRLRWSKCPFYLFCLSPNDGCKLNSACFGALMGANRKLKMVIVQITCTLLLLPSFYGPSSALKTDVPLRSTARVHINSSISPRRISLNETEYLKDGPCSMLFGPSVLCVMLCREFKGWAPS